MSLRVIKPEKIKKLRGGRSLREVSEATGKKFSFGALAQWERGTSSPTPENIVRLMEVFGCTYEDLTEPFEMNCN